MKDMPFNSFRYSVINFSGGPVNALSIMQDVCNFPTHEQMFDIYRGIKIDYQNAIIVEKDKVVLDEEDEGLVEKEEEEVETEDDDAEDDDE